MDHHDFGFVIRVQIEGVVTQREEEMQKRFGPVLIVGTFTPPGRDHLEQLRDTLRETGVPCELGEDFGGSGVSEGVRKSIQQSSFVMGLLERKHRKSCEPSSWALRELALASALGKPCVSFVEHGLRFSRELLGDIEFIPFKPNNFSSVFPRALREVRSALGLRRAFEPWFYVPHQDLENACDGNARVHLELARSLGDQAQFIVKFQDGDEHAARELLDRARHHAEQAVTLDANCWQALIALGGLLQESGRLDEAHHVHVSILEKFKNNNRACAAAYHNLGVELERRFPFPRTQKVNKEIVRQYEHSLRLDPSRIATRAPLVCFYLRLQQFQRAIALADQWVRDDDFTQMMREELRRSPDLITLLSHLPTMAQNLFYPRNLADLDQPKRRIENERLSFYCD